MLTLIVFALVPVSYSAPVKAGLGIIYSFLISKLLFKEKFTKKQLAGVVLGFIAIIIMNIE